jgi:ribosome maturation factor RimP
MINSIVKECGVTLYDTESVIENGHKIFRVYIVSEEKLTLNKCEEVTKVLSPIFDVNPPIDGEYFLEVSSPGIERKLTKPLHFQYSIDELIKIQHTSYGKLKCRLLEANSDMIRVKNQKTKEELSFRYEDIVSAKTYYIW